MKLKVPPALVAAIIAGVMRLVDFLMPFGSLKLPGYKWLSGGLLFVAGAFGVLALFQFYRNGTSINPHKPEETAVLVTGGIYQISRNPMYLALFLLLIAYATLVHNVLNLLVLPIFIWYMNRYQIIPEEKVMEEKFGDEFVQYKSEVGRWL